MGSSPKLHIRDAADQERRKGKKKTVRIMYEKNFGIFLFTATARINPSPTCVIIEASVNIKVFFIASKAIGSPKSFP